MPSNRYSAKPRFGLIRETQLAGFGLCVCKGARYEQMMILRFGLIREVGFGTWHGPFGTAPHLERHPPFRLNGPTIFSLAWDNSPCFIRIQVNLGLNAMGYMHPHPNHPKEGVLPNPKLKFLDQCLEVMRFKQLSGRTVETYLQWIRRYILFHRSAKAGGARGVTRPTAEWVWRHPKDMGEPEVRAFLTDLAVKRGVVAATQNQALNALLFLYREVLGGEMAWVDGLAALPNAHGPM